MAAAGLVFAVDVPDSPRGVHNARRAARAWLDGHAPRSLAEDAELVVSELLTNAIRHVGGPARLELVALGPATIRVDVTDRDPRRELPEPRAHQSALGRGTGGRGLAIVDALTTGHRVLTGPAFKTVSAELERR